jgi:hypothetical protein
MRCPMIPACGGIAWLAALLLSLLATAAGAQTGGAGITFRQEEGDWIVASIAPGGPAAEAGVPVGAVLRTVDRTSVDGWSLEQLGGAIRGRVGTKVVLSFRTDAGMKTFEITRADLSKLEPGPDPAPGPEPRPRPEPRPETPRPGGNDEAFAAVRRALGDAPVLLGLTPDLVQRFGAPSSVRIGTRFVYDTGSSYSNDANDHWLFHEQAGGGTGISTIDVAGIEGGAAVLVSQFFGYNPDARQFEVIGAVRCHAGPAAAVSDFWIHPELLKTVDATSAFKVRRGTYRLHGREHNVLRVRVSSGSRTTQWMYDTDSGYLLVYRSGSTIVAASPTERDDEDWDGVALNHMTLLDVRHIDWPGAGSEAPGWVRGASRLRYEGSHFVMLDGNPPVSGGAIENEFRALARGRTMVFGELVATREEREQGRDALSRLAFGSGSSGPGLLFITPEGFKALRSGQVLDREPRVGFEVVVAHKDAQQAVIELRHPLFYMRRVYDAEGRMVMAEQGTRQYTGWQGWRLQLAGVE